MKGWVALLLSALLCLGACGSGDEGGAPSSVEGVIIDIESEGFDDVRSFTLKAGDRTYEIRIDPEVTYGFALSHLNAHRVGGDPVVVELEEREGDLFATSIEDA